MSVICMRCSEDIPARDCPCRAATSKLARVTMAAAALAGEHGKAIGADEMRIASSVLRSEVDELDGFRAGDLVEYLADKGRFATITDLGTDAGVLQGGAWARLSTMACPVFVSSLRRKPVEVGDTVRLNCSDSPARYTVAELARDLNGAWARCHEGPIFQKQGLITIAPTVKP